MSVGPWAHGNWTRNTLLAFSAIALNHAVLVAEGQFSPLAFRWLLIACLALIVGVFGPRVRQIEDLREKPVLALLVCGLALQFFELLRNTLESYPGGTVRLGELLFIGGIAACALLTLAATAGHTLSGKPWFVAIVVVHFFLGLAYLRINGVQFIDVFIFQQSGSAALLSGHNPYELTFPNIYGAGTPFYSPSVIGGGRTLFGFPYPPLSLLMCLPGYLLTGDVRYSHLLATTLSGLLIGFSGRGLLSKLAALLFLFSPTIFLVVLRSWTEPFVVLLFSIILFQCRLGRSPFLTLGLLIASKQYLVLAAPLATWFLMKEPSLHRYSRLVLRVGASALVVTLPLALWNFRAFFYSVGIVQFLQPLRRDALSIPAWIVHKGFSPPPVWIAFLAVGVAGFLLLKRLHPSPTAFATSLAVMYLVFFSLNKQAFLNYYFLVVACLCGAIAAADIKDDSVGPLK